MQTLDTSESIVTLTLGTDYTVTGVNRYNGEGGSDISAASWLQNLYRAQHAGYAGSQHQEPGGFFPEIHEDALDKLTMLVQQAYGWWSGLSLRKPSWLANYYDALNNRIRNLRDPSQAHDAATKGYTDNPLIRRLRPELQRTLFCRRILILRLSQENLRMKPFRTISTMKPLQELMVITNYVM